MAPVATGFLLALAGPAHAASPAGAQRAEPLVDRVPTAASRAFDDRFVAPADRAGGGNGARAAANGGGVQRRTYATRAGGSVTLESAAGYAVDPSVGASYVAFLDTLPHGAELSRLTVRLVSPAAIATTCGGSEGDDILACYDSGEERMYVPGQEVSDATGGITTSYVIAHEYGHHVAQNRDNAPFPAVTFGPKRWASYAEVCAKVQDDLLAPGNEGSRYTANPGENWAEVYARLTYPEQRWTFSSLLVPDAGALAAARADVLDPWTKPVTKTFRGSFSRTGKVRTRSASVTLTLDGAFTARLTGPKGARYDLRLKTNGGTSETARASSTGVARLSYSAACRSRAAERVTVTAVRRSGSAGGAYALTVKYAG